MKIKIPKAVMVPLSELKMQEKNVKKHSEIQIAELAEQMKTIGFKDPIVIDKNKKVWAGHGRIFAAKYLEMDSVPCIYAENMTIKQLKEFMIKDNAINESPWDKPNLIEVLLEIPDFKFESVDFSPYMTRETIEDEIPPLPDKPKSKLGDTYQLGNHRIMCGDSTNPDDIKKLLNGKVPDLVLTDPKYNIGFKYNEDKDKKTLDQYTKFCNDWWKLLPKCPKIFTPGPKNLAIWYGIEHPQDIGIWHKPNSRSGASAFHFRRCEPILFYGKFKKRDDDFFQFSMENYGHLNQIQSDSGVGDSHAPAKPLKFWIELVSSYSKSTSTVLDIFLGTGTTLIACQQTERTCYGMEIDPRYIDVIITRWEQLTGLKAKKI